MHNAVKVCACPAKCTVCCPLFTVYCMELPVDPSMLGFFPLLARANWVRAAIPCPLFVHCCPPHCPLLSTTARCHPLFFASCPRGPPLLSRCPLPDSFYPPPSLLLAQRRNPRSSLFNHHHVSSHSKATCFSYRATTHSRRVQ